MANKSDNGLYLPLKVDLSGWEKSLATAEADLQKVLRQMRSEMTANALKFDVEITGAKAAGDDLRAYQLEIEKVSMKMQYQASVISGLKKRLSEINPEKDATGYKKLASMIDKETIALNKLQIALNDLQKKHEASVDARIEKEKELLAIQEESVKRYTNENQNLKYDVQIKTAKQVGEAEKAKRLEIEKAENAIKNQKALLADITKQITEQEKKTGKNSAEVLKLTNTWLQQKNILLDMQNNLTFLKSGSIFKGLLEEAKELSPELAKIGRLIGTVGSKLGKLAGMAGSLGPVGVALAGMAASMYAVWTASKNASDSMRKMSQTSAETAESVYTLAERLNLTYQEAEMLDAVFTLDGTSAETFVNAVQKLNKQLLTVSEDGNLATKMLEKYNVELRNADGSQKSYVEQLQELAKGYKQAKEAGEELDFITATLGAGGNQYVHLLNGLDDNIKKTKELTRARKTDYDLNHEILTVDKQLILQQKELAKASYGVYNDSNLESKQKELTFLKERTKLMNENKEMYEDFADNMKFLNEIVTGVEGRMAVWLDNLKMGVASATVELAKFIGLSGKTPKMENKPKTEENKPKKTNVSTVQESKKAKKEAEDEEKRLKAYEKLNKELRDVMASDYEKSINALKDKKQAFIDEGVAEVDAERLFVEEKRKIDEKYFNDLKKQREEQAQKAEETYKKEIEAAKQAREASISDAESTLRSNLKLVRYIQRQQKQGTYNESDIKAYAERLYMKQNGFRMSDISALNSIGVDKLKDLANARDRLFSQFSTIPNMVQNPITNNNNVTINFDNTVLDNVAAMDVLANKVADVILPTIERAVNNTNAGGVYGYSN